MNIRVTLFIAVSCLSFCQSRAQSQQPIRINCGGFKYSIDTITFITDRYYTGTFAFSNYQIPDILGTAYDSLYYTERGPNENMETFFYNIPVENGTYTVYLHFAEIYWGAIGGDTSGGVGKRIFSVFLEGFETLKDYDIYADVGAMTSVVKSYNILVSDDTLNIEFRPKANRGKISAIEVIPPGSTPLWVETTEIGKPDKYNLQQNYPNPFNPVTNIQFSIPEAGFVKLSVFNVIGQTIDILLNEFKNAGTYNVQFTIKKPESGIYFYRIETEKFTDTKKMIILK